MRLNWHKSESTVYPDLVDTTSSKTTVYLRKNVTEKWVDYEEDHDGYIMYEYDEAKLTKDEYKQYLEEVQMASIPQMQADIDYIALMSGIDLEV